MRKLILIVHTSLDGYVAGEDGSFEKFDPSPENLDFVCSLTDKADAMLAGRNSYEMLQMYWPTARDKENASESEIKYSNWYNNAEKIVLSDSLSGKEPANTTILSGDIANHLKEIKKQQGKNILMFGSPTAFKTLSQLNLIDEYWIIQYPALFGEGLTFFTLAGESKKLQLLSVRQLSKGEVVMNYKLV